MERSFPPARDLDDARSLQRDLAEVFASPQRRSDAEKLDEVRRLCGLARIVVDDEFCHACLQEIERYAESFFIADDENVHWAWHTPARYARLRALLLRLVNAFGIRLTCLRIRMHSAELSEQIRSTARQVPAPSRIRPTDLDAVKRCAAASRPVPVSPTG